MLARSAERIGVGGSNAQPGDSATDGYARQDRLVQRDGGRKIAAQAQVRRPGRFGVYGHRRELLRASLELLRDSPHGDRVAAQRLGGEQQDGPEVLRLPRRVPLDGEELDAIAIALDLVGFAAESMMQEPYLIRRHRVDVHRHVFELLGGIERLRADLVGVQNALREQHAAQESSMPAAFADDLDHLRLLALARKPLEDPERLMFPALPHVELRHGKIVHEARNMLFAEHPERAGDLRQPFDLLDVVTDVVRADDGRHDGAVAANRLLDVPFEASAAFAAEPHGGDDQGDDEREVATEEAPEPGSELE